MPRDKSTTDLDGAARTDCTAALRQIAEAVAASHATRDEISATRAELSALKDRLVGLQWQLDDQIRGNRLLRERLLAEFANKYDLNANFGQIIAMVFCGRDDSQALIQRAHARVLEILNTPAATPVIARGYAFLHDHGIWFGGTVTGMAKLELCKPTRLCTAIPVTSPTGAKICRIPIEGGDDQVYIGLKQIAKMIHDEFASKPIPEDLLLSLRDAGVDPS